ncbi:MAG: holo-ACP synthase [Clostridiales bacterium]|jgi:holo-[acyl-carrier protein] synthase|nr:holo-ACP synthase [Clostridiales bacterium]
MVLGIGCDIIKISRVARAINNEAFVKKYFTASEIEMLMSKNAESYAGNFAAKEAVAKALGTGFSGFFPDCIEVLRDKNKKPVVNLYGKAREIAEVQGIREILVSISHCNEYAIAYAIAI